MPRERKPLIVPGSILPVQDPPPLDLMANIIARDRARRHPAPPPVDDTETQEPVNTGIQEYSDTVTQFPVSPGIQETVNPETQEDSNLGLQETSNTGIQEARDTEYQLPVNTASQEPAKTAIQESGNTETQQPVLNRSGRDPKEPTDKATFDMPRDLNDRLKMQSVWERRPARAIVIQALTEYLGRAGTK